ncbi:MAG TPA: GGDEF domain-containing protein [Spirochaetales bacterium]|nr:GGDEF domain-containing protein [Spirochaetales bacterium]
MDMKWEKIVTSLDYAFQPIVNIHTGVVFGLEALLRNWKEAGFESIQAVFDRAYEEQQLYSLDLRLRALAVEKFLQVDFYRTVKLFYNLDNRLLTMPNYSPGNTARLLDEKGLLYSTLCFEISERHEIEYHNKPFEILENYKQQHFRIAIDDFGAGYSGLKLLYHSEPDMLKLDRFFIASIGEDVKKKLFVAQVVNMAHIMGIIVIAEGVETEREFYICREIGCDFVQGYLVQQPVRDIGELKYKYESIEALVQKDKRYRETSQELIYKQMECLDTLRIDESILTAIEFFRKNSQLSFVPVVNENNEPLGVLREKDLKQYVYSPFGVSLLRNRTYTNKHTMLAFLSKLPIVEIHTRLEKILEIYASEKEAEAVLITENGKYRGVLSSRSLLEVLNEKQITEARDQNPLSKLPGNTMISEFIVEKLSRFDRKTVFVYFDFDYFKPFNDTYGFRQGDRVILLFSDLLREAGKNYGWFIGHIGGDDFFVGISEGEWGEIIERVRGINRSFTGRVESFYSLKERKRGYIFAHGRDGKRKRIPLLRVSAAVLCIQPGMAGISIDEFSRLIADLKLQAKNSPEHLSTLCLNRESDSREPFLNAFIPAATPSASLPEDAHGDRLPFADHVSPH